MSYLSWLKRHDIKHGCLDRGVDSRGSRLLFVLDVPKSWRRQIASWGRQEKSKQHVIVYLSWHKRHDIKHGCHDRGVDPRGSRLLFVLNVPKSWRRQIASWGRQEKSKQRVIALQIVKRQKDDFTYILVSMLCFTFYPGGNVSQYFHIHVFPPTWVSVLLGEH
jgi:hypothetical protein